MSTTQPLPRIPEVTLDWRMRMALAQSTLSVQGISDRLGYSRQQTSRWLSGRGTPRGVVLKEWALATGVPYQWLATGEEPPETDPGTTADLPERGIAR